MQRVADVQELFLPVQFKFVQGFRTRLPAEAVEFLTVDTDDVAEIAVPAKNRAEDCRGMQGVVVDRRPRSGG